MVRLNLQMFAKSVQELAKEVIQGKYGNGQARKDALGSRYAEVQAEVNKMIKGGSSSNTTNTQKTTSAASNTLDAPKTTKPDGADQSLWDKANETWEAPKSLNEYKDERDTIYEDLKTEATKDNIVSQDVWDAFNTPYQDSEAVIKANEYLNASIAQLNSGKTQYTDRFNTALDNYLNREDFEYDVDKDPLFQQALASAMNSGKSAMQDTIGQASALTGGYGSTYATTAGNQAYNAFIEDAYNNLPEYYQMALEAYQAEGQELYNQVALLGDADANEWQKIYTQYQVNSDNYWNQKNFEYGMYQDNITNMYNKANLQLNEHGQEVENLSALYGAAYDRYAGEYQKYYQEWSDSVTKALNLVNAQTESYWQEKTFRANYESDGNGGYQPKSAKTGSNTNLKTPTETQYAKAKEAYNKDIEAGDANLTNFNEYLDRLPDVDTGLLQDYVADHGNVAFEDRTWTKSEDTMNGFLWLGNVWGDDVDPDDKVKDENGNEYRIDQLPASMRAALTNLKGDATYNHNEEQKKKKNSK